MLYSGTCGTLLPLSELPPWTVELTNPLANVADSDEENRVLASSSTPEACTVSAFARCLMISCGVLDNVIDVIASSSTFQKLVMRADTRPRVTITPTSPPVN